MDNFQQGVRHSRRTGITLAFAGLGGMLGLMIAIVGMDSRSLAGHSGLLGLLFFFLSPYLLVTVLLFAALGAVIGLGVGSALGASASRIFEMRPPNESLRSDRQIVGETCNLCEKRIACVLDGGFCKHCAKAFHFKCLARSTTALDASTCKHELLHQ